MFKRFSLLGLGIHFTVGSALAQQEFNIAHLDRFAAEKVLLQSGANSKPSSATNGTSEVIQSFYSRIPLQALIADYSNSTEGLRKYLSDLKGIRSTEALRACMDEHEGSLRQLSSLVSKAQGALEGMDDYIAQPIYVGYSSRFGSSYGSTSTGREQARSLKDHFAELQSQIEVLAECCLDSEGKSNGECSGDVVSALTDSGSYPKIKAPVGGYPNPLMELNMPAEELAYFLSQDPTMQQAIARAESTGDFSVIHQAWSDIQTQCLADKEYVISKEVKRQKNLMAVQDIAKAVQCTMPSILAHNGSYGAFQASLGLASLPIRTKTHQFGCAPGMIQALAGIRTNDHAVLTERYGTDKIVPTWVFQNMNDLPVQRRSFVQQLPGGLATSSGFIADVPQSATANANPRAQAQLPAPVFASNVPVNQARGPASERIAPSRGNSPRGRALGPRPGIQDSRNYALGVRTLASKIESGEEVHKNARLLAQGASNTRGFVRRVAASLESRGSSRLRQERSTMASAARLGVQRAAASRGAASGARTSARDTLAFFQDLQRTRVRNQQSNPQPTPAPAPQAPTVAQNPQSGGGNKSDWDSPSRNPASSDPWAKLRKTQAALDAQIMSKNNEIDNLVKHINQVAEKFGNAKRELIAKFSAPIVNAKIAGKTPGDTVTTLSNIRKGAYNELTFYGALNAQINDLKGKLVAAESSLGNLLVLRGAASGQPTPFNSSPFLQNFQPPVPVGLPQNSPFAPNASLPQSPVPRTGINPANFSWNLFEAMIPKSWAAPGLQERLDSFEQWTKAAEQYARDLDAFSLQFQEQQKNVRAELYESYQDYYWSQENPETMTEMRMDLVAGVHHYNKTLQEEVEDLLVKIRGEKSAGNYDRELVDMLERAKNDASDSQQALVKILKMYVESYPAALEDNPELWWSQVSNLLLY